MELQSFKLSFTQWALQHILLLKQNFHCAPAPITLVKALSASTAATVSLHPPLHPLRSKHPIYPPGCCLSSSSSSALTLHTGAAQKHLVRVEGTRQDRAGCGRKQGSGGRWGGQQPYYTICHKPKPPTSCPVKVEGHSHEMEQGRKLAKLC